MNIYIGVDGGCTKTSLVAVGPDGEVLGGITGEGINFNSIGMQRARDNLS
ncbi:MAG: ATPase, partial [Clostridiales bacterium]|nr:ATPase [Clostridiales bacterium]